MPLYEFACDDCGKAFEKLYRSMGGRRRPACPHCDSRNVHKKFSTFAAGGGPGKGTGGRPGKGTGGASCATCTSGTCSTCGG